MAPVGKAREPIYHLVFSPNGQFLAATLKGGAGLRVWETTNWSEVAKDENYGNSSANGAVFGPDGTLYTVAYGGSIRRYDNHFHLQKRQETVGGRKPYGVSVQSIGQYLAVGFDDKPIVDVYDKVTLRRLFVPDTKGISQGFIRTVALVL